MKVAIHQPQYVPWLPYFLKIEESDVFIILDSVDFQKNGLHNRNQIKTSQGVQWLTVPVKQQLGQKICDVKIDETGDWCRKHWQTIRQSYGKAIAFKSYEEDLKGLYEREWQSLNELNIELITSIMLWLNIKTPIIRSSQMDAVGNASDLVLNLCLEVGADRYLSGTGGKSYLDENAFNSAGVAITYRPAVFPERYPQLFPKIGFINHLTALDILFNCGESWRTQMPLEIITK